MDIKEIRSDFIICEVPEHDKHKDILLNLIDEIPNNPYQGISKTDYNLPQAFERKYIKYFISHIAKDIMDQQQKYFKAKKWEISNVWFQQYEKGAAHPYHNHAHANFTNVYFVELPDEQFKTSLKTGEQEYDYKVKEGQIITFPAYILHASKKNLSGRKTVISFNSNFIY